MRKLIFPNSRFTLEHRPSEMGTRVLDLFVPIGRGQRGYLFAPPYSGKRLMLCNIGNGIVTNHPEVELLVLLVSARPEEITETKRQSKGKVIGSTFSESPARQIEIVEEAIERAGKLAESGKDVVVLLDTITHLIRAYSAAVSPGTTTVADALDVEALERVGKLLRQVGNLEQSGSLTFIATLLVDTGSPADERIYEALKGTENLEIHLDSTLLQKMIFPSIDLFRSRTRKEELLLTAAELKVAETLREAIMATGEPAQAMESLISLPDTFFESMRTRRRRGSMPQVVQSQFTDLAPILLI